MAHIRAAHAVGDAGRRARLLGGTEEARRSKREVAVAKIAPAGSGLTAAMKEGDRSESGEPSRAAERWAWRVETWDLGSARGSL